MILGHPCKFQPDSRLGSVTARQSSSGRQPNFVALNRGRHLYLAGRPSHWALAHISSLVYFLVLYEYKSRGWQRCAWPVPVYALPLHLLRFPAAGKSLNYTCIHILVYLSKSECVHIHRYNSSKMNCTMHSVLASCIIC